LEGGGGANEAEDAPLLEGEEKEEEEEDGKKKKKSKRQLKKEREAKLREWEKQDEELCFDLDGKLPYNPADYEPEYLKGRPRCVPMSVRQVHNRHAVAGARTSWRTR